MDRIADPIFIGNYLEAQDRELLSGHGIRSVLSLDGTLSAQHASRLGVEAVVAFPLIDGPGNNPRVFRLAVESLGELVRSHPPVLVHCHAGRSRSVVTVAGHFTRSLGLSTRDALAAVTAKRDANVTRALRALLDRLASDGEASVPA